MKYTDEQIAAILHEVRDDYARAGRGDADVFRQLENQLIPLTPGEAVQFQALGNRRWLNGVYDGPVENPDDPYRDGDVYVLTPKGRRVAVFLSSVQRRASLDEPATTQSEAAAPTTGLHDRWSIVVIHETDGTHNALSHRLPGPDGTPFAGPWGMLTEDEATALAEAYNADERDESKAEAVAVYRYDRDPEWPENYA